MNKTLKDLFVTTLNIAKELFVIIDVDEDRAKHNLIYEIAIKSNLELKAEEVEEIFKKELEW